MIRTPIILFFFIALNCVSVNAQTGKPPIADQQDEAPQASDEDWESNEEEESGGIDDALIDGKIENQTSQPETIVETKEEPKAPPVRESKSKPETQVFRPTEEISEDVPVPFPVDI